jgi:8-oxo-dGTP pyrophosphatase MutT (NUDIX family)
MKEFSAGILFIYNNKILLVHHTGSKWTGSYGYPKGRIDKGETPLQTAIREAYEEVGIKVNPSMLEKTQYSLTYNFKKKDSEIYKTAYYFICNVNNLADIGLEKEVVPKSQLQLEEVDWAGFVDYKDAKKRIGKVFKPLLKHYKVNESLMLKTFEEFLNNKKK